MLQIMKIKNNVRLNWLGYSLYCITDLPYLSNIQLINTPYGSNNRGLSTLINMYTFKTCKD